MLGMGWLRDLPDHRDWDAEPYAMRLVSDGADASLAAQVDIRRYCSPIENQGGLGSCVAQAIVGMAEFLERLMYGRHTDASRLFVYKMARVLDGFKGDTGAHIRTGMKAMALFGAPPERYWPYIIDQFDAEPPAFVYTYGQSLQAVRYYRIDIASRDRDACLAMMKQFVGYLRPVVLGFSVYSYGNAEGEFPMPEPGQRRIGGHAVMVCGYDDGRCIGQSKGALLIRNSWGRRWGNNGYGWLPYDYITRRLSSDFWTLLQKETVI